MSRLSIALAAMIGLFSVAAIAAPIDIGPAVGSNIPATFKALDQTGAAKTYKDISGKNGTVIYFVRSAKWCPFCQTQMIDVNSIKDKLDARGYAMVALSYDAPDVLANFATLRKINYTLLSDQKSEVIDAFGIRDPQYPTGHMANGVPRPAIFVVDAKGVVQAKLAEEGYKVRPTSESVLAAIDALKK
jgi:peroxiredoxin